MTPIRRAKSFIELLAPMIADEIANAVEAERLACERIAIQERNRAYKGLDCGISAGRIADAIAARRENVRSPEEIAESIVAQNTYLGQQAISPSGVYAGIIAAITAEREQARIEFTQAIRMAVCEERALSQGIEAELEQAQRDLRIVAEYALAISPRCEVKACMAVATTYSRIAANLYCDEHVRPDGVDLGFTPAIRIAMEAVKT